MELGSWDSSGVTAAVWEGIPAGVVYTSTEHSEIDETKTSIVRHYSMCSADGKIISSRGAMFIGIPIQETYAVPVHDSILANRSTVNQSVGCRIKFRKMHRELILRRPVPFSCCFDVCFYRAWNFQCSSVVRVVQCSFQVVL